MALGAVCSHYRRLYALDIPSDLSVAVMVNGSELYTDIGWQSAMERLFLRPPTKRLWTW